MFRSNLRFWVATSGVIKHRNKLALQKLAGRGLRHGDLGEDEEEPDVDEDDVEDEEDEFAKHLFAQEHGSVSDDEDRLNYDHPDEGQWNLQVRIAECFHKGRLRRSRSRNALTRLVLMNSKALSPMPVCGRKKTVRKSSVAENKRTVHNIRTNLKNQY